MKNIIEIKEDTKIGNVILEKGDRTRVLLENNYLQKYAVYPISERAAYKIREELNFLIKKILNGYEYAEFGFDVLERNNDSNLITFNLMYGNELISDIEYKSTLKNLKNNNNFKVKDETDEKILLFDIIETGDRLPKSIWDTIIY